MGTHPKETILNTFEYEIFLSYGWAGGDNEREGARRWARAFYDRLIDLIGQNLRKPRIFFDGTGSRTGSLDDRILNAVEQSALMAFLVSPGSCRPGSWCQKEATWFLDKARPLVSGPDIAPPEDRVFRVIQSELPDDGAVDPLARWNLASYNLVDSNTGLAADWAIPTQRVKDEFANLVRHICEKLALIQRLERTGASRLKVFLGSTFASAENQNFRRLRRQILLQGCEVRSATPLPNGTESQAEYGVRIEREFQGAGLAVHMIPGHVDANGWEHSAAALQLQSALLRSQQAIQTCPTYTWHDPKRKSFDEHCDILLAQIPECGKDQRLKEKTFEELESTIKAFLIQTPRNPNGSFDVVIEYHEKDSKAAAEIRDLIDARGCAGQLANATVGGYYRQGRRSANAKQFYNRARRFVVLFGRTTDVWVNYVCLALSEFYDGTPQRVLLIKGPPPEDPLYKERYKPPFPPDSNYCEIYRCPHGEFQTAELEEAIGDWLGGPCR